MQYGDLVYFTACGEEPVRIWTKSINSLLDFELACKSEIRNPINCLFRLGTENPARNEALKGQAIRPGVAIRLVHLLSEDQVSWICEGLIREIRLTASTLLEYSYLVNTINKP